MTYRQYIEACNDEFERTVIIVNLARKHPKYDSYSPKRKAEVLKELLDTEIPQESEAKHYEPNYKPKSETKVQDNL